ncbi:MAG: Trx7/PDZ domain-containing (seleno)protein [Limisphaerales bacterium]
MACHNFDEQVVRRDPEIADLMDQFVCVRIVAANDLDLSLFQFDYDLTFSVFFLNADRTIYGRFGSRSDAKASKDISMEGFRKALAGALELHKNYPANKTSLAGKRGPAPRFKLPEDYPSLKGRQPRLDYGGQVARSCVHCHMVGGAERSLIRAERRPIPDDVLFAWPIPDVIGLSLDPKEKAKIVRVAKGSPAAKAGFRSGDQILSLEGQPMISTADVQWVLQNAGEPARLRAAVLRGNSRKSLTLNLGRDWRHASDISWRTTTWDLRRMGTGGLVLEELPDADRQQAKLRDSALALRVKYVGEYGEHAAGKRAGFQKGDIIISADGQAQHLSEGGLLAYLLQRKLPGDRVPMTVLRAGQRIDLELPMQ